MNSELVERISNAPAEVLIALLLATAERVMPKLNDFPEIQEKVRTTLNDIKKWGKDNSIKAANLYEHLYPLSMMEENLVVESKSYIAFFSILNALSYIVWRMDGLERVAYGNSFPYLPADMADISDETAVFSLECAMETEENPSDFSTWIESFLDKPQSGNLHD